MERSVHEEGHGAAGDPRAGSEGNRKLQERPEDPVPQEELPHPEARRKTRRVGIRIFGVKMVQEK